MLSWIEVSESAIRHNYSEFAKLYPNHIIYPVIKSEAYGAGLEKLAGIVAGLTDNIAVVSGEEALRLRKILPKHRILVLSLIDEKDLEQLLLAQIELPLYNEHYLNLLANLAHTLEIPARVHAVVDTGTHRVGFSPNDTPKLIKKLAENKNFHLAGIFSHYAASEELPEFTHLQTKRFEDTISASKKYLAKDTHIHMSCSAASAIFEMPRGSNALRLGLSLYGYWPSPLSRELNHDKITLTPSLAWKAKIIHLQELDPGETIGYGCTYEVKKRSTIATLPVGYFDGYSRQLSNLGHVLVGGKICPVRGRICMNLMMIDVSGVKDTKIGDTAVLLGKQGKEEITADSIANHLDTINYEFISRLNPLLPRVLVK